MAISRSSQHLPATTELPPGADVGGARPCTRMRGRPEGAWIGRGHGPGQAEPGGTRDNPRPAFAPLGLDPRPALRPRNRTKNGPACRQSVTAVTVCRQAGAYLPPARARTDRKMSDWKFWSAGHPRARSGEAGRKPRANLPLLHHPRAQGRCIVSRLH